MLESLQGPFRGRAPPASTSRGFQALQGSGAVVATARVVLASSSLNTMTQAVMLSQLQATLVQCWLEHNLLGSVVT